MVMQINLSFIITKWKEIAKLFNHIEGTIYTGMDGHVDPRRLIFIYNGH